MKKVFIISGVLFVAVLGLWLLYNVAFHNSANNPIADPLKKELATKKNEDIIINADGRLEVLVNDLVVGAAIFENTVFYYSTRDRAIRSIKMDGGTPTTLYANIPGTPTRLVWSPRRDAVLLLIEEAGQSPLWHHLDLSKNILTPLQKEMSRLAWSNIGESILYQHTDPTTGAVTLRMADPDSSNWKKFADVEKASYFLAPIPRSSLISFWKRPSGLETNRLEAITIVGDRRKTLFADRYGMDILWSRDGTHLLIGSVAEKGKYEPSIGLTNENGGEYRDLGVPTLISKVVWSQDSENIYYALPGAFPKETILPENYYAKLVTTKDTFWKMNVRTGKRERLIPLEEINEAVDATDLFLSNDELFFFFTDRVSGKLYRINL